MEKIKILIVEDDKLFQLLYDHGFVDKIFEKRIVGSGEEALEVYRSWLPNIIILDIMLPKLSGFSVLERIRLRARDKSTTIIMATSISEPGPIHDCIKLGIQGYIIKPFNLKKAVRKVLKSYQRTNPDQVKSALVLFDEPLKEEAEKFKKVGMLDWFEQEFS